MKTTAGILWLMYVILTALETVLLRLAGMDWFDAVFHAFSTMSSGGFSSRNAGLAFYASPRIEWICCIFMLAAGFNFTLLFRLVQGKGRELLANSEARAYGAVVFVSVLIITMTLLPRSAPEAALREAAFYTASLLTTTGLSVASYNPWPPLARAVLFMLLFIGGCSGSTAGGVKVIRHVVLWKQMGSEMKRLIYPKGVFSIRLNGRAGSKNVVYGVAAFVFVYALTVAAAALLVSSAGVDLFSSLNAGLITVGNIGLGLGDFGPGSVFLALPAHVKWGLSLAMLAGRLELWTALVFFTHWRY